MESRNSLRWIGTLQFDRGQINLPVFDWHDTEVVTWEATVTLHEDRWQNVIRQFGSKWELRLTRDIGHAMKWSANATRVEDHEPTRSEKAKPIVVRRRYDLAVVVSRDEITLFVDGEELGRKQLPPDFELPTTGLLLGDDFKSDGNRTHAFHGTIDEIRFSNIARYAADYTPVDRFEADEHTIALYHCDEAGNTLVDSSGNGYHVDLQKAVTGNVSRIRLYDEANMSAADLLATGEYEWQVEKMPEPINSPHAGFGEYAADMTADGLTIVFSSYREEGSYGQADLWEASRDSIDAPWNEPVNLGHLVNSEERGIRGNTFRRRSDGDVRSQLAERTSHFVNQETHPGHKRKRSNSDQVGSHRP